MKDVFKQTQDLDDVACSLPDPFPPSCGSSCSSSSSAKKKRKAESKDPLCELDLNDLEQRIKDWCDRAELPFHQPARESDRVSEKKKINTLSYLDSHTVAVIRELQRYATDNFKQINLEIWDWILESDLERPYLDSFQALVVAKVARSRLDLDFKKKTQNVRKREDLMITLKARETTWLKDMSNFS
jgi:hypothetical protein